jgi:hypothetical protein
MSNQNLLQREAVYGVKYGTGEKHQMQVKCLVRDQDALQEYEPQAPVILNRFLKQFRRNGEVVCISLS